jgi:hypothetical protein
MRRPYEVVVQRIHSLRIMQANTHQIALNAGHYQSTEKYNDMLDSLLIKHGSRFENDVWLPQRRKTILL